MNILMRIGRTAHSKANYKLVEQQLQQDKHNLK
jgi:hypothetical protein